MVKIENIALFGGTFDPVHEGHLEVAKNAVDEAQLDRVIFLPCRQSPHKDALTGASGQARFTMLKLATAGLPWALVDDWELQQAGRSYSWRTAEVFRERHPQSQLFWLMGKDQWDVLHTWSRVEYLSELVRFIVHDRAGRTGSDGAGEQKKALFVSGHHPASASAIRQRLQCGETNPSGWLSPTVADYIQTHGLYRS